MATHPLQALTGGAIDIVDELGLSDGDEIAVQVRGPAGAHYYEGGAAAPSSPDAGHVQGVGTWAYFTVSASDPIWYWTTAGATRISVSSS